jgi:hypothetical protein
LDRTGLIYRQTIFLADAYRFVQFVLTKSTH